MLKIFGYGDNVRKQIHNDSIELLNREDYRTSWDFNRPIINLFDELEKVYEYLDALGRHKLTDEGVFTGSLNHEFDITPADTKRITLYDKRDNLNVTSVSKVYTRLRPGIAGVYHNDPRQESMIIVHKPNIRLFERQVSELLGLFYHNEKEGVWVKYNPITHTYKCKISKQLHPTEQITDFYFGCLDVSEYDDDIVVGTDSQTLIESMYNNDDLNTFFVQLLNHNIENLFLEPLFEITTTGIKYWIIQNGEIALSNVNDGFYLGQFTISNLTSVSISGIDKTHRRYGHNIRLDIYGIDDNSYEMNTNGGIEYNIAKGMKIDFDSGAIFNIDTLGNVTLNTSSGKDLNFGGANLLDIKVNIINTTAVFTQKGTMNIDADETGESFNVNATTQNKTIGTKNETITGNETKSVTGTSVETNTGKKTINANNELELNGPLLDVNNTTQIFNGTTQSNTIATQNNNITTKNDTIGTHNESIENKVITASTELELNGPLLDVNNVTQTFDGTTQSNTLTTRNNNITNENKTIGTETDSITTLNENIGTKNKTVIGNETEIINGNSTETVDNTKTSNANNQRINATVDIILSAPNITFDSGVDGTITFIGKNQIIEGDTVRLGDNIIELNKNQTGIPAAGTISGIDVNRGTETKAQLLFRESDDSWVSGLLGALKAIANREDNSVINSSGVPSWDATDKIFKTDSKFTHNRTTGTLTINTNNATTTPPLVTNSTAKVLNMNVDKVDGVDVDNTGAVVNRLAFWNSGTTIHSRDFTTTLSVRATGSVNNLLPTEKAVQDFANARFALDNSFTIANTTKGVSISYTNGDGTSRTFAMTNIDVDKVDGVDINSTGAANGEIAIWTGATTIGTGNKLFTTSATLAGDSDANIPTEKAVKAYVDSHAALTGSGTHGAVSTNTVNRIVIRDGNGDFAAREITAILRGNADSASTALQLTNSRTFSLTGLVTGSATFNGTGDCAIATTVARVAADSASTGIMNQNGKTKAAGQFYSGVSVPTNSNRLNYDGNLWATAMYNANWNDLAEFMDKAGEAYAGDVLIQTKEGLIKSNKRASKAVIGVYSDTFGYALGAENAENKHPVGLSGRVKVKVKEKLEIGDLLVSDIDGFAVKATPEEEMKAGIILGKVMEKNESDSVNRIWMLILNR